MILARESRAVNLSLAFAHKSLAVALLSCVRTQPATWPIYKDKAAQLQAAIEEALPANVRATAVACGQSCTLEEMIATPLGRCRQRKIGFSML